MSRTRLRGLWRGLGGGLLVGVLLALGAAACSDDSTGEPSDADPQHVLAATAGAEKAARAAITALTTYDHDTIDEDFAAVAELGTATFDAYHAEASKPIRDLALKLEASAKGKVLEAATDYEDDTHVEVLLFVDQSLTQKGQERAQLDQLRVRAGMVLEGSTWLLDEVEVVNRS